MTCGRGLRSSILETVAGTSGMLKSLSKVGMTFSRHLASGPCKVGGQQNELLTISGAHLSYHIVAAPRKHSHGSNKS